MDVPVYLFTGFMDSGKTTLISDTLLEQGFAEGRSLVIVCEEGDEEYDEERYQAIECAIIQIEAEEEFSSKTLKTLNDEYKPQQVFIEYNGTWKADKIFDLQMPEGWSFVQCLTTVDAGTFDMYLNNMRTMIMEQFVCSDVVIVNRCTEETDKTKIRRTIKAKNRRAQVVYERVDGTIDEDAMEELPYDINQDEILITDEDYGIFYIDIQDDPKKYVGKKVRFIAQVHRPPQTFGTRPIFIAGRFAMTCCVEDIQFIGFKFKFKEAESIPHKAWIDVTSDIRYEFAQEYRGRGPVLYPTEIKSVKEPEDNLVYFS